MNAISLVVWLPLFLLAAGGWAINTHLRHLDRKAARP
jgi:hypothetical protein